MVVSESKTALLGKGIYTPQEAAYFARIPTTTLLRWVYGNRGGEPVIHSELDPPPDRTVTFLDLVQSLAVRAIRVAYKVPLQRIREAVDCARERFGVAYPFAMQHRTFLFGTDIVIELPRLELTQISGRQKGQAIMREIAEPFLLDLTFSSESQVAVQYRAFSYGSREVLIDPSQRYGQPIVLPCRHSVYALVDAYVTEGGPEAAAEACGVEMDDVLFALRYDDHLRGTNAA